MVDWLGVISASDILAQTFHFCGRFGMCTYQSPGCSGTWKFQQRDILAPWTFCHGDLGHQGTGTFCHKDILTLDVSAQEHILEILNIRNNHLTAKKQERDQKFWPIVYKIAITLFCCVTQLFVQRSTTQMSSDINKYNAPESQVDF